MRKRGSKGVLRWILKFYSDIFWHTRCALMKLICSKTLFKSELYSMLRNFRVEKIFVLNMRKTNTRMKLKPAMTSELNYYKIASWQWKIVGDNYVGPFNSFFPKTAQCRWGLGPNFFPWLLYSENLFLQRISTYIATVKQVKANKPKMMFHVLSFL